MNNPRTKFPENPAFFTFKSSRNFIIQIHFKMKKLFLVISLITIIQNNSYSQEGWFLQYGTPTSDFTRVFMIDSLNGWVLGFDSVFNTSDGGNNWIYKNIGIGGAFTDIYFINIQTGWLSGITYVRKTTDYGENWSPPYYFGVGFTKLFFVDVNTGFVAAYGTCWRTTNGGVNWTNLNLGSGVSFFSIDFNC